MARQRKFYQMAMRQFLLPCLPAIIAVARWGTSLSNLRYGRFRVEGHDLAGLSRPVILKVSQALLWALDPVRDPIFVCRMVARLEVGARNVLFLQSIIYVYWERRFKRIPELNTGATCCTIGSQVELMEFRSKRLATGS